ncbi:MAG: PKD domain-containing protein [Actinomycetota bacterium]
MSDAPRSSRPASGIRLPVRRLVSSVLISTAALGLGLAQGSPAAVIGGGLHAGLASGTAGSTQPLAASSGTPGGDGVGPVVRTARAFGVSKPVAQLPRVPQALSQRIGRVSENEGGHAAHTVEASAPLGDGALQSSPPASSISPTSQNFEGIDVGESSSDGVFVGAPPDTNGDVGPNDYVQIVNTTFAIYSKTGELKAGPSPINSLWDSAPQQFNCDAQSRGDPIVQYDALADRWLISQFNFPGAAVIAPPFDQCFAISQTADPTGAYFLYDFTYSATLFNDYPHIGVWPDAYYMSVNQYDTTTPNQDFHSAGACAFDRTKMLAGDASATSQCFDESASDPMTRNSGGYEAAEANSDYLYHGQLPSDVDGTTPPPAGEPNFFMQMLNSKTPGQDKLLEFKFHVDWATPTNSWFGSAPGQGTSASPATPIEIPVADFDPLCNQDNTTDDRNCIPQVDADPNADYSLPGMPDVGDYLDSIGDRLMYRLAYRNFGDHEALVLNNTVNAGAGDTFVGNGHAGIRWYEIRDPDGTPTVFQESTFAPDAAHRWMGSIAMDQSGNIALGYSKSSSTQHPSINYVARHAGDPLDQMTLGEGTIIDGMGTQQDTGRRWGDYSAMQVDPDGCTFWYTQEYYAGTGTFSWNTRIGAFALPKCGDPKVSLGASASLVPANTDFTYTIGVISGVNAATATITDTIPAGLTLLSATPSTGSCSGSVKVTCDVGQLPAGGLATIELKVHAGPAADITNTVDLLANPDGNPANNSASVAIRIIDPCAVGGAVLVTDTAGDQVGTSQQDVESVAVGEPFVAGGANKLVFTLKVNNLSPAPQPNSYWYEYFSYGKVSWFVVMETASTPVNPTFRYGYFAIDPTTGVNTENDVGVIDGSDGDTGAFNADGTITITLSDSKIDPAVGGGSGTPPGPGSVITNVHGETRNLVGVLLVLADGTASANYTLVGNAFCAPNTAPTASLTATPTSGKTPLPVSFDASGSSDPDSGDSVGSFTFRFGDGTPPVTQATPTVSHTYLDPGVFHASVLVRDQKGLQSTAASVVDITVTGKPRPTPTPTPTATGPPLPGKCTILGTAAAETLVGTPGADVICGLGGKDKIIGRGGADIIYGGGGNDRLRGGPGKDRLFGGKGADRLAGGSNRDVIHGGGGRDRIGGGSAGDKLFGDGGDDTLNGGSGKDSLNGGRGSDRCSTGTGGGSRRSCER